MNNWKILRSFLLWKQSEVAHEKYFDRNEITEDSLEQYILSFYLKVTFTLQKSKVDLKSKELAINSSFIWKKSGLTDI